MAEGTLSDRLLKFIFVGLFYVIVGLAGICFIMAYPYRVGLPLNTFSSYDELIYKIMLPAGGFVVYLGISGFFLSCKLSKTNPPTPAPNWTLDILIAEVMCVSLQLYFIVTYFI